MIILHLIKICFTSSTNLDHIFKQSTLFNDPILSFMTLLPEFKEKFIVLNGFKFLIIFFDTPKTHSTGARFGEYWGSHKTSQSRWMAASFVFCAMWTAALLTINLVFLISLFHTKVQNFLRINIKFENLSEVVEYL